MTWDSKTVLVTGGTGYLGQYLCKYLEGKCHKIIAFGRDPHKHEQMQRDMPYVRPFVGDVRDQQRLTMAMEEADLCVHAAAMKSVPMCEYNPADAHSINVQGTLNVLNAARKFSVPTVFISTDKAVEPVNLYGKTKALAEHITLAYNSYGSLFSVVRYGNVMGSAGSVLPYWRSLPEGEPIPITNTDCTRFWVDLEDAVELIEKAFEKPGQLVVGRFPAFNIYDLAVVVSDGRAWKANGLRKGEKKHETLIGENEGPAYTSLNAEWRLDQEELRERIHSLYEARPGDGRRRESRGERFTVLTPYSWPENGGV